MTDEIKKLTCRDTTYLVSSARDTPLTSRQTAELDAHLLTCSACRTARQQFAEVFSQLETLLARGEQSAIDTDG